MQTGAQTAPRLSDFIRDDRDRILEAWTRRVRDLPVATELPDRPLMDHLPGLLDRIAEIVSTVHEEDLATLSNVPELHALDRLDRGFDLEAVAAEYALLRRCVLDLYRERYGELIRVDEVARFNDTIDDTVRRSVAFCTRQRMRILSAVDRLTTSWPAGQALPELLDRLLEVFIQSAESVDTSSILLVEGDHLVVRASLGLTEEAKHQWAVPIGTGFAGTIAASRKPSMLRHASEDPLLLSPYLRGAKIRALYGVPLLLNERLLGVAHMGSRTAFDFSDDDRALFRVLTTRASAFIYESLLRASAERRAAELGATLEAIPGAVFIGDRDAAIVDANRQALSLTSADSPEALRRNQAAAIDRLNIRCAESGRRLATEELPFYRAARGEVVRADLRIERPGGTELVTRAVAAPIRLHGEVAGSVCVCLDISDQKKLEEERLRLLGDLEEEREQLHQVLRQVPAGVVIAEVSSGRILLSNQAAEAIWREPLSESTVHAYRRGRLFHVDGRQMSPDEYPLMRAIHGETVQTEVKIRRGDGTWGICLSTAAPVRHHDGSIASAVVVFVDITERKSAEEQLRAFADNISQFAWIADANGEIYWYNRRWYEYTGTTFEEVRGWSWQKVHHPDHVERVVKKLRAHFASGEVWEDTYPLRGKDGRYRWFLSRAVPIRDPAGRVVRWFGTNTDITEQRRIAEAREQFVGILGHDLRNPLGAIALTADTLLRKHELAPRIAHGIQRIAQSAERMRRMISDLLDFTRGRLGGGIPVERKQADLRSICRAVVDEIQLAHPGTRIHCDSDGDTLGHWDPERMAQVVQNLLGNAIEHGLAEAAVRLTVDGTRPDLVTVTVWNQGPAIRAELIPHLFEPFRRLAESSSSAERSSLGLGLYIVSEIVHAHHGEIFVRSTEGEGTSFECRIPRT